MALFRKKADPISERSKSLNDQIAALEAEIQRLSHESSENGDTPPSPPLEPVHAEPIGMVTAQPRLRSTTFPHKHHGSAANPFSEPVFEDVPANRGKMDAEPPAPVQPADLGVRKYDLPSLWHRLTNHFRGPATSNPKLVNYLAAGSIQGLRPLRYEKRVARNRFIVLVLVLIAVLWGLIAVLMKRT